MNKIIINLLDTNTTTDKAQSQENGYYSKDLQEGKYLHPDTFYELSKSNFVYIISMSADIIFYKFP